MAFNLNDQRIRSLLRQGKSGKFADGGGLYFRITAGGSGVWIVRYVSHGKRREITLDKYPRLSLVAARASTAQLKANLKNNVDPLAERRRADNAPIKTVDSLADDWLKDCQRELKHPEIPHDAPHRAAYGRGMVIRGSDLIVQTVSDQISRV